LYLAIFSRRPGSPESLREVVEPLAGGLEVPVLGARLDDVVEEVERRLVEAEPIERLAEGVLGLLLDRRDGHLVAGDDPVEDQLARSQSRFL
jgi:hypothetical protein